MWLMHINAVHSRLGLNQFSRASERASRPMAGRLTADARDRLANRRPANIRGVYKRRFPRDSRNSSSTFEVSGALLPVSVGTSGPLPKPINGVCRHFGTASEAHQRCLSALQDRFQSPSTVSADTSELQPAARTNSKQPVFILCLMRIGCASGHFLQNFPISRTYVLGGGK